jgi:hypothetical protein
MSALRPYESDAVALAAAPYQLGINTQSEVGNLQHEAGWKCDGRREPDPSTARRYVYDSTCCDWRRVHE